MALRLYRSSYSSACWLDSIMLKETESIDSFYIRAHSWNPEKIFYKNKLQHLKSLYLCLYLNNIFISWSKSFMDYASKYTLPRQWTIILFTIFQIKIVFYGVGLCIFQIKKYVIAISRCVKLRWWGSLSFSLNPIPNSTFTQWTGVCYACNLSEWATRQKSYQQ